jgi:hypothetical protein
MAPPVATRFGGECVTAPTVIAPKPNTAIVTAIVVVERKLVPKVFWRQGSIVRIDIRFLNI